MAAAVDLHVAGIVSFLFFSDFPEDEDLDLICRVWAMFSSLCRCFAPIHRRSGFGPFADPCVVFAEGSEGTLLTASTCAIQLRVPCHLRMRPGSSYADLREHVTRAVRKGDYFGCLESRSACTPVLGLWSVLVIARSLSPK